MQSLHTETTEQREREDSWVHEQVAISELEKTQKFKKREKVRFSEGKRKEKVLYFLDEGIRVSTHGRKM